MTTVLPSGFLLVKAVGGGALPDVSLESLRDDSFVDRGNGDDGVGTGVVPCSN